ncbi:MAG TPA: DUF6491 family protein [Steroidobacteraceae bacterium]|nr:DUF6491 family protein [Steroidobacteraceae bacterium]
MQATPAVRALRLIAVGLLAALIATVLGCASGPGPGSGASRNANQGANQRAGRQPGAALPGTPACFYLINFDGSWTVLSDTELIVYAPLYSNPYYIRLLQPVLNLRFDEHLGFVDVEHSGMICNNAYDDLLVPNWTPHRVPIVAVRRLTLPESRQLLIAHHIKPPAAGHDH